MTARWHIGPITGAYFWWVLVTSPEILVFLFFMITDPKTIPTPHARRGSLYAVSIGLLAALLIAPAKTEFWAKVAVLGALTIVCAAWPLLEALLRRRCGLAADASRSPPRACSRCTAPRSSRAGIRARPQPIARAARPHRPAPADRDRPSRGVQSTLDRKTARRIAADLVADLQLQAHALARRDAKALARAATFDAAAASCASRSGRQPAARSSCRRTGSTGCASTTSPGTARARRSRSRRSTGRSS